MTFTINRTASIPGPPGPAGPAGSAGGSDALTIRSVPIGTPTIAGTEPALDSAGNLTFRRNASVNILDFAPGLVPNGSTYFDAAYAAAAAAVGQVGGICGGTILFPAGYYKFANRVPMYSYSTSGGFRTGLRWKGEGGAAAFPNSQPNLQFDVQDTWVRNVTLSAPSAGLVTVSATPPSAGTFSASYFDCSATLFGSPTETNNNQDYVVVDVASDGSTLTLCAPQFISGTWFTAEAGATIRIGTGVGIDVRSSDCAIEDLRLIVGGGKSMSCLIDFTESNGAGHGGITKFRMHNVKIEPFNYITSHMTYGLRIGRSIAVTHGAQAYNPPNCDWVSLSYVEILFCDQACIGVPQRSAQSRSNVAFNCGFNYSPAAIFASQGTQWDLFACWVGGNATIHSMTEAFVIPSGPPTNVHGLTSEGATGFGRIGNVEFNAYGWDLSVSAANARKDGVILETTQLNGCTLNFDAVNVGTSDLANASIYTNAGGSFETQINFTGCTLPTSNRVVEYKYMPGQRKGPYIFSDGDVLTFVVGGVTQTVTLHTTGSVGVPKQLDNSRRWLFGVSGSTILEAQQWELAQLIEEQLPTLGAFAYSDQSKLRVWHTGAAGSTLTFSYPGGAGDPGQKLNWGAGTYVNTIASQCTIDNAGWVGPGPNNTTCWAGTAFIGVSSHVRANGPAGIVRTGTAPAGPQITFSGVVGLSGDTVATKNLRGTATILNGNTFVDVTLPTQESTAGYFVFVTPVLGISPFVPAANVTSTGFRIQVPSAVGADTAVNWLVVG